MQKVILTIVLLSMAITLISCKKSQEIVVPSNTSTTDITSSLSPSPASIPDSVAEKDPSIDIDLTSISSTMVFGEISSMMYDPASYVGKTIKVSGAYDSYYDELKKKDYHGIIIKDATGCCPQGIRFIWNGEHNYPNDYPNLEEDITIKGIFKTYIEDDLTYYYIETNEIILN